jgi:hypothetical protein
MNTVPRMQSPNSTELPPIALGDLSPIDALARAYPGVLTVQLLRWQLRYRETNGLGSAVVRIGKRLFISRSRYEHWLAQQAERAAA